MTYILVLREHRHGKVSRLPLPLIWDGETVLVRGGVFLRGR